ncbi:magnesium transporter CorA family protein [uncultured Jatrophihabitans sp.]|uniref:magnesium transporter CorA family protein n=1 Tax=uncultured Jatrophihabitans sp. TaxID=1610747 RepID=UPI0035CBDB76
MVTCLVRTRVWRDGVLEKEDFPLEQVSDYLEQPDCLVWADLISPGHDDLGQLAEELSLDPHAVEDSLSRNERPKAMRYPTHVFLTVNPLRLDADADEISVGRVSVFSTHQAFVTVRLDDIVDMDAVLGRWDDNSALLTCGPRALLHGLLDEIVDRYFDITDTLNDQVDAVEDILFEEVTSTTTHDISQRTFTLRRALVDARRAVLPMRDVVNTVTRRTAQDEAAAQLAPYYDDLYDHILRIGDLTDSLRDEITSIFDTNMSLSDTRMNVIMKKLTSWAAIIAVPTAVTGFFGQNVPYPGFGKEWGFVYSLAIMVVIALVLYAVFRRKDWL